MLCLISQKFLLLTKVNNFSYTEQCHMQACCRHVHTHTHRQTHTTHPPIYMDAFHSFSFLSFLPYFPFPWDFLFFTEIYRRAPQLYLSPNEYNFLKFFFLMLCTHSMDSISSKPFFSVCFDAIFYARGSS